METEENNKETEWKSTICSHDLLVALSKSGNYFLAPKVSRGQTQLSSLHSWQDASSDPSNMTEQHMEIFGEIILGHFCISFFSLVGNGNPMTDRFLMQSVLVNNYVQV